MNRNTLLFTLGAMLSFGWVLCHAATEVNSIAAVVNNQVITKSEVRSAAQMQVQMLVMQNQGTLTQASLQARVREIEQNALKDLVDRELILSEFTDLGATIRPQHVDEAVNRFIRDRFKNDRKKFIEELTKNGMTIKQFREMQEETIIVQAMRSRNAGSNDAIVTPFEREKFWKENQDLFAEDSYVKLRTITIPKVANNDPNSVTAQRRLVDEVSAKLRGGADFASMAKTYSVDSAAEDGGARGTFARGDLNSELASVAFTIQPRRVSDPIDLGDFYTLVYVDARELGKVAPLKEVEEEVERRVLQNKRQEKVEEWLERLRRDANIRIFE